jgi:hypothetical protein
MNANRNSKAITLKGNLNKGNLFGRNNLPKNNTAVTGKDAFNMEIVSIIEIYLQTIE